jgi:hypothetical protein
MKRKVLKIFLTGVLFSLSTWYLSAQDLTGIWKGYFITESGENYRLEFQVNQSSNLGVSGVSYSYLDVRFYGKASMTGTFLKKAKNFKIREIKTVELKNISGGGACIMNFNLQYNRSGKEEFLEGVYLGKPEVKDGPNPYKWGQCGSGKVFLRKVTSSDFYIEPFLRGKIKREQPVIVNQPPVKNDKSKDITVTRPEKKPVLVNQPPVRKQDHEIVTLDTSQNTKLKQPDLSKTEIIPAPSVIKNRSNELVKILTVSDPNVLVKIYDNGEIDDDTISVYLDNKLMLSSQRLTASPLILKFTMKDENQEHELVMVAENMGRIPPNTSLMIVESGGQRYEVRITSTEQKNAVVRFKYERPG